MEKTEKTGFRWGWWAAVVVVVIAAIGLATALQSALRSGDEGKDEPNNEVVTDSPKVDDKPKVSEDVTNLPQSGPEENALLLILLSGVVAYGVSLGGVSLFRSRVAEREI